MVRRIAHRWVSKLPANIELDDLEQVGLIAVAEAFPRFDADKGAAFATFATHRVNGAILDYLRKNDCLSRKQRKIRKDIDAALDNSDSEAEAAELLGMDLDEFRAKNVISSGHTVAISHEIDGEELSVLDYHASTPDHAESIELRETMQAAFAQLSEKEQYVITELLIKGAEFDNVAGALGVSASRISQIKVAAMKKLQMAYSD
jgi:RNA polymerase sigma factor for flagellar operon FliA